MIYELTKGMKNFMKSSALVLTGALLIAASFSPSSSILPRTNTVIFDSAKNEYRVVGEKVGTAWGSGKTIQEREVK